MLLALIDATVEPVARIAGGTNTGLALASKMCRHCLKEVAACVADPQCRAALECLQRASLNDQVGSYQCVSASMRRGPRTSVPPTPPMLLTPFPFPPFPPFPL